MLGTGERPYTQQDAMALIARAASGEDLRIEWNGRFKDGTLRWHEVFIKRVTINGKDRVMALARDIHARKVAEEVAAGHVEQGLLVCGSGTGMAIAANSLSKASAKRPPCW